MKLNYLLTPFFAGVLGFYLASVGFTIETFMYWVILIPSIIVFDWILDKMKN
jgi:hypothetical protein